MRLRSEYLKSIFSLITGSALSQLIMLLTLPVLTRVYSPDAFDELAVFVSLVSLLTILFTFKYDIAIPKMIKEEEVHALILGIFLLCVGLFVVTTLIFYFSKEMLSGFLNISEFTLFAIPIGGFACALMSTLQFYANREKKFNVLSVSKVLQASACVIVQLTLGYIGFFKGLVVGQVVFYLSGFLLIFFLFFDAIVKIKGINLGSILAVAKKYKTYPRYVMPDNFFNMAGMQVPILLIVSFGGSGVGGEVMLIMKIMQAPMMLIGSSVSQVFYSYTASEKSELKVLEYTVKTSSNLFYISVPPLLFLSCILTFYPEVVLGRSWGGVAEILPWLLPYFLFHFLASPLSLIMHVRNLQKTMFLLTFFGGVGRITATLIAVFYYPDYIIHTYGVFSALYYLVCLCVFLGAAKVGMRFCGSLIIKSVMFLMFMSFIF